VTTDEEIGAHRGGLTAGAQEGADGGEEEGADGSGNTKYEPARYLEVGVAGAGKNTPRSEHDTADAEGAKPATMISAMNGMKARPMRQRPPS
jgi:hypothetical protein